MFVRRQLMLTVMAGAVSFGASPVLAQEADDLPEVEVIQQQSAPAPQQAAPQATPTPQPPASYDYVDTPPAPAPGARGPDGRTADNAPELSPVDPSQGVLPADLQNYVGAGTRVDSADIALQRPKDNHEILTKVPGVMVVNDDGMSRHSGIGVRGSPIRRSRKVLVLEDGQSINMSSFLDPSTHYTPPTDRVEAVEVIRGYNVPFGPLTNHGVINFKNLSPFGAPETVISAAIGTTDGVDHDINNRRHFHTRQHYGNVGAVVSYSGEESGGAWDNEVLRYNDFYGALGWKGIDQDLTVSGVYFRQRDDYDEDNFEGTFADFIANKRRKSGNPDIGDGASDLNSYNADYFRLQVAHNWYVNDDTTVSTRLYGQDHERNRFSAREELGPDFFMRGRNRHYRVYGADSRVEFANVPLFAGLTQDIQAGINYEHHSFRNCTAFGEVGQILKDGTEGDCFANGTATPGDPEDSIGRLEKFESDAYSAFIQTAMHLTSDFTLTPGVRFVHYNVDRNGVFAGDPPVTPEEAGDIVGREKSSFDHVLPGVAFAWEAMPRSTVYGSYQRGFTPSVARGELFPLPEEVGDNFQIGLRSTAIRGFAFDLAYFHSRIDDYQIKEAFTTGLGANIFGTVDEVEINGFELGARLESNPFTGGPWNFFGEATYTYADSEITKSTEADEVGKWLPEVPRHFANLSVGVQHKAGWDASVSWTYRGEFHTDTVNTSFADADAEDGEVGLVPDVWLLSARANYTLPGTNTTLFVAGQNLTNEFYLADRADGMKPGIGRTLWAGFTYKFD